MNKNLRWKILTILGVLLLFTAVGVYPIAAPLMGVNGPSWLIDKSLKLGLDLKGGVHLVLRVITDEIDEQLRVVAIVDEAIAERSRVIQQRH